MKERNVLKGALQACCSQPPTGFYRDGYCRTDPGDSGSHILCAIMTDEFLEFTRSQGNDLGTPMPYFQFPGLKAGDRWCLCALRWKEAYQAGLAPPVVLEATHEKVLEMIPFEWLLDAKYSEF